MSTRTKLASLVAAALLPCTAFAQAAADEATSDELKTSLSLGVGYSTRAQYDRDPYERTSVRANLGFSKADHSFGLSQAVNYRHGSARYYGEKNGPTEELYNSDTGLSYGYGKNLIPALDAYKLTLSPSAGATLGTSRQSTTEDHLKGTFDLGLDLAWEANEFFTLTPGLGYSYNFYDWKVNEDGEANTEYATSAGLAASVKYQKLSFTQSVQFSKEYLYNGYRPLYTFANSSSLGYSINERFTVKANLTTSDSQLRYGRNNNFKMYDKDITRFTIEVTSKIL